MINPVDLNRVSSSIREKVKAVRKDSSLDLVGISRICFKIGKSDKITNVKSFLDLVATARSLRPSSYQLGKEWLSRKWIIYLMMRLIAKGSYVK